MTSLIIALLAGHHASPSPVVGDRAGVTLFVTSKVALTIARLSGNLTIALP